MSSLLIYAIKSAILLTLLFVPGIFLIFREKMFRFNRFTLLAILVLSLVLPLCNISSISMDTMPAVQTLEKGLLEMGVPVEMPGLTPALSQGEGVETPFPWFYIVSILYAIGAMTVLAFACVRYSQWAESYVGEVSGRKTTPQASASIAMQRTWHPSVGCEAL